MDTLNTKRETQILKSSVDDIPWANTFQQTLIVALLRFYKHLNKKKRFSCASLDSNIFCYCLWFLPSHYHLKRGGSCSDNYY